MKPSWMFSQAAALLSVCLLALAAAAPLDAAEPVNVKDGKALLTPDNTRLQFVCAHLGDKPDPRTGTFAKFTGAVEADAAAKTVKALSLEIDANSLATEFGKLTAHLKGPDFFDARQYPKASFVGKKFAPSAAAGEVKVTGDLTLHGVTKEISVPVKTAFTGSGLTLTSEFAIDRSEFGMTYGLDKVDKNVTITFVIGEKNKVFSEAGK